jgi:hypothetical protein
VVRASTTRLQHQLEARTRELADAQRQTDEARRQASEALEREAATSEVLRVISSSPGELEAVFQAILTNAVRICGTNFGDLYLREADGFRMAASHNAPPAYVEARPLAIMPSAGPGQNLALAHVGCPDRRIDRLCITCRSLLLGYDRPVHRSSDELCYKGTSGSARVQQVGQRGSYVKARR